MEIWLPDGIHNTLQRLLAVNGLTGVLELWLIQCIDQQVGEWRQARCQGFEEVTKQWDAIPIPADILEPASIHTMEEILVRPRP